MRFMHCKRSVQRETNIAMKIVKGVGMFALFAIFCVAIGFVVRWLWNALMPQIFGLGTITYWQGVGLVVLGKIIFGGFGGGSHDSGGMKSEIKREIKSEIEEEIRSEIEKEMVKDLSDENEAYDEMYEKWWTAEGEKQFEDYMSKEE